MDKNAGGYQLDAELARFAESGLSITVCGRDAGLVPSVAKAVGCRVGPDRRRITVFLMRDRARDVLRDIAANGHVAVAMSLPTTHRTIQLKGRALAVAPMAPGDEAHVRAGIAALQDDLAHYGFAHEITAVYLDFKLEGAVAVTVAPDEAFEQTPGPNAGARLA